MGVGIEKGIELLTAELADTLLRKNHDYGNSAMSLPLLIPSVGIDVGMLVRLGDKISRLKTLLRDEGIARVNESIEDTLMDMAGYCTLLVLFRREVVTGWPHGEDKLAEKPTKAKRGKKKKK